VKLHHRPGLVEEKRRSANDDGYSGIFRERVTVIARETAANVFGIAALGLEPAASESRLVSIRRPRKLGRLLDQRADC
jgi:hypothetical protein